MWRDERLSPPVDIERGVKEPHRLCSEIIGGAAYVLAAVETGKIEHFIYLALDIRSDKLDIREIYKHYKRPYLARARKR